MVSAVRWDKTVKETARDLRNQGASFSQIREKLGIPKSTLHYWVRDLGPSPYQTPEAMAERFKKIQKLGALANKKKKESQLEEIILKCKEDVSPINLEDKTFLKALLAMLYWAEGSKTGGAVKFVNTDPRLALLYITLLRRCYEIDEEKIRLRLHLHYYHKIGETKKFWTELLNVPDGKVGKIYIKKRSVTKRFRRNFMGICFVIYHDVKLQRYILNFGVELGKKINGG